MRKNKEPKPKTGSGEKGAGGWRVVKDRLPVIRARVSEIAGKTIERVQGWKTALEPKFSALQKFWNVFITAIRNRYFNREKPADTKPSPKRTLFRKLLKLAVVCAVLGVFLIGAMNYLVCNTYRSRIISEKDAPDSQVAIVLGCYVSPEGVPCAMLIDRVKTGVDLYHMGKVKKILMTGDHGLRTYDEVNSMRLMAQKLGVPAEDLFMDHAGFNTYESMYRAREVFQVKNALIVTQKFHLGRAVYLANRMGIDAYGIPADRREYWQIEYHYQREIAARTKAFLDVNIRKPLPTFLGPIIPIEGDGRLSHDLK